MKRTLFALAAISALFITGCDKVTRYSKNSSYKIRIIPDSELKDGVCKTRKAMGAIIIEDSSVVGEIQNKQSGTILYLSGDINNDTKDVTLDIREGADIIGVANGRLWATDGYGTWVSNECYGKWEAVRED